MQASRAGSVSGASRRGRVTQPMANARGRMGQVCSVLVHVLPWMDNSLSLGGDLGLAPVANEGNG